MLSARSQRRIRRTARLAAAANRQIMARAVVEESGGAVMSGLFRSMRLSQSTTREDAHILPKLLGCYEEENLAALERIVGHRFDCVVNVGCASGFFAVGAAIVFEPQKVVAVDPDDAALRSTVANAELNGVGEKLEVRRSLDPDGLVEIAKEYPTSLVISDCEGFETELFSDQVVPHLAESVCLIECHDFLGRDIVSELSARFDATHEVRVIEEGPRNPNQYEVLRPLNSLERWLAVTEHRPEAMRWILADPKKDCRD